MERRLLMISYVDLGESTAVSAHFLGLMREFARLGFAVQVILPRPRRGPPQELEGVTFHWTPNPQRPHLLSLLRFPLQLPAIIKVCWRCPPAFIYLRYAPLVSLELWALKWLRKLPRLRGLRLVLEVNGWDPDERKLSGAGAFKLWLLRRLHLYSARTADLIRVVTPGLKELLTQEGIEPEKIFVAGNGTDVERFLPLDKAQARAALGLEPDNLYVGFIGNLARWQGVDLLLRSVEQVARSVPGVKFLIGGGGPELEPLKQLARELGVAAQVIFSGEVPHERASFYINCFDIGVALKVGLSRIGFSPLKIRDYAACGVPIVASRVRGLEMVEEQGMGLLTQPEDPEALAEALIKLLSEPELRLAMGRRARAYAEGELSWRVVAEEIVRQVGKKAGGRYD